jgi:uncharacterized protein (UPF0276 family)
MDSTPHSDRELSELRSRFTLIPHSLGLSPGSAEKAPEDYLIGIDGLARKIRAPWWSDHLAITRVENIEIGHLAPLCFTHKMVDLVSRNLNLAAARVGAPLIVENIAYTLRLPGSEMTEAEFISEVLDRTDCGLLLDLMNLHANASNHGYDPYEFLSVIPLDRVVQIHIIGGHYDGNILVDSHTHRTPDEVWRMLQFVADRTEIKAVLLEWDDHFPGFPVILSELERAKRIVALDVDNRYARH